MPCLRRRGEGAPGPPVFEAAPLDIYDSSFPAVAAANQLELTLPLLRHPQTSGDVAIDNPTRRRPEHRVRDVYLNDPDLQKIYPLGLLPIGQKHFLSWLTTHGRKDQQLNDGEILWFLKDSAENELRELAVTYLLQPLWQEYFPAALTAQGWNEFRRWVDATYGRFLQRALPEDVPLFLSTGQQGSVERSEDKSALVETEINGVNILGHFCSPSGIQQAALWTKAALERAGLRTSCRDVPVPRRILPQDRLQWLGLEVFPVTILNQAGHPFFVSGYDRSGLFWRDGVYRIAYWNWELETVPDEWLQAAELVSEIWSPTAFVAQAMRSRMPRPVYHILPGVDVGPVETVPRASLNIPEEHVVFLFMFDLHSQVHRKNPLGVFRAFRKAFRNDDKVTLVIKTSGGDAFAADFAQISETIRGNHVILLDEMMSRARSYGLIDMSDCFVSLHRSEGFGLGLAESMLMAKPVIATGYSGNLDFMNRENSMLVDYEMTEITEDRPIYKRGSFWAEPSIEQAAAYMREMYEHPEGARSRARQAQPVIESLLSLEAAGQRMKERLRQIHVS